jgi:predicted dehydrogenase
VGHLGAHHARIYAQHPDVDLIGVTDRDPGRARAVALELGCRVFPGPVALAQDVDLLSVAVPAQAHAEVAIPCLERGTAVLVEKPMAASLREAEAIAAAAAKSGTALMVGHVERWNGAWRRVRPRLKHPRFIEAHRLSSFGRRGLDVDVIFDLMIHDLDLVASLAESDLSQVAAVGVPVLTEAADIANVRLEYKDGLVANLTASRVSREKLRKLRIFQADAYFSLDFAERTAEVVRRTEPGVDPAPVEAASSGHPRHAGPRAHRRQGRPGAAHSRDRRFRRCGAEPASARAGGRIGLTCSGARRACGRGDRRGARITRAAAGGRDAGGGPFPLSAGAAMLDAPPRSRT